LPPHAHNAHNAGTRLRKLGQAGKDWRVPGPRNAAFPTLKQALTP
jgi:hypothetical protein